MMQINEINQNSIQFNIMHLDINKVITMTKKVLMFKGSQVVIDRIACHFQAPASESFFFLFSWLVLIFKLFLSKNIKLYIYIFKYLFTDIKNKKYNLNEFTFKNYFQKHPGCINKMLSFAT